MLKAIEFRDFDKIPNTTTLKRNNQLVLFEFAYNEIVPTIELDLQPFLNVKGSFRFELLYIQWFKEVEMYSSSPNLTFPGELHAVFYDTNFKSFEHAAAVDKSLVVLAFNFAVRNQRFL